MPRKMNNSHYYCSQNTLGRHQISLPFYAYSVGITRFPYGRIEEKHPHDNPFAALIWVGKGIFQLYDECHRPATAEKDYAFWHLSGEYTWWKCISPEGGELRWLCFDGPLADATLAACHFPKLLKTPGCPDRLFDELEQNISSSSFPRIMLNAARVMEIMAHFVPLDPKAEPRQKVFESALQIIRLHIADPAFSVKQLCEELRISRMTINRLFRSNTKETPSRYIHNRRFELAKNLLSGSDARISEIAQQCGFENLVSFNRFFRRAAGISPREYRLSERGGITSAGKLHSSDSFCIF